MKDVPGASAKWALTVPHTNLGYAFRRHFSKEKEHSWREEYSSGFRYFMIIEVNKIKLNDIYFDYSKQSFLFFHKFHDFYEIYDFHFCFFLLFIFPLFILFSFFLFSTFSFFFIFLTDWTQFFRFNK